MRTRLGAAGVCLAMLVSAGCGATSAGEPTTMPGEASRSQAGQGLPKHGAPEVEQPLDVSGIAQTPCKAVTKDQLAEFTGTFRKKRKTDTTLTGEGKSCGWTFEGERYSLGTIGGGVVLPSEQYQGLSTIYRGYKQGRLDTFRPIEPIAGYPALIYTSKGQNIGEGMCRISIGLRNDTVYRVQTLLDSNHPNYDSPCESAKKLAGFVVQNLKEAQ